MNDRQKRTFKACILMAVLLIVIGLLRFLV